MPTVKAGVVSRISDSQGILGCINEHDGSGYIHAMLEAFHPSYSRTENAHYRTNLAKSVRIGALPSVLRSRYGSDPLCAKGCSEARAVFNLAIAFGSPLPAILMHNYADYLGVAYRLYNAELQVIDDFLTTSTGITPKSVCNIIATTDDEYHLLVKILPSKRGDSEDRVRFTVLDAAV